MSREQAMIHMLDAASKMQRNVSMILEAKAVEAEKVRNWALNHLAPTHLTPMKSSWDGLWKFTSRWWKCWRD